MTENIGQWVSEPVTPYKLASYLTAALNEALETDTFDIAPQQIYGSVRSGTLEVTRFDSGHMKVTPAKANAFIQARIDRQLSGDSEGEESDADESADDKEAVAS
jgi:hypothetical protein